MSNLFSYVILPYFILSAFQFVAGLFDHSLAVCNDPLARIEYVFPAYQFGCYMGDSTEDEECMEGCRPGKLSEG